MAFTPRVLILISFLIGLSGCVSSPLPPKVEYQASLGTFSYGMSIEAVQSIVGNEGKTVFKGLHNTDSYVLVSYIMKNLSKRYIFSFKNLTLIAIIEGSTFSEAWSAAIQTSESLPFEDGLEKLYQEIMLRKDKIITDNFLNVDVKYSVWVQPQPQRSSISETLNLITLAALAVPVVPYVVAINVLTSPLQKYNEDTAEEVAKKLTGVQLGDSIQKVKDLLDGENLVDVSNESGTYEVYGHNLTFGARDGAIEWISSYQHLNMIRTLQKSQGFRW